MVARIVSLAWNGGEAVRRRTLRETKQPSIGMAEGETYGGRGQGWVSIWSIAEGEAIRPRGSRQPRGYTQRFA